MLGNQSGALCVSREQKGSRALPFHCSLAVLRLVPQGDSSIPSPNLAPVFSRKEARDSI